MTSHLGCLEPIWCNKTPCRFSCLFVIVDTYRRCDAQILFVVRYHSYRWSESMRWNPLNLQLSGVKVLDQATFVLCEPVLSVTQDQFCLICSCKYYCCNLADNATTCWQTDSWLELGKQSIRVKVKRDNCHRLRFQCWTVFSTKYAAHSLWYCCSCGDRVLHSNHYVAWQHFGSLHLRSVRLFTAVAAAAITATAIFQQAVRPKSERGQKSIFKSTSYILFYFWVGEGWRSDITVMCMILHVSDGSWLKLQTVHLDVLQSFLFFFVVVFC